MATRAQCLRNSHMIAILALGGMVSVRAAADAVAPAQTLDWSIRAAKEVYYPGEPVLLVLTIRNNGQQHEEVDFGMDGIEAFSMEMHNSSGRS